MLAKVVDSYSDNHSWGSAVLITLLVLGCYGYMLWFWWTGLDRMQESPCGSLGFFVVATFNINNWIKWVVRIVLLLAGVAIFGIFSQCISALIGLCACLIFQFGKSINRLRGTQAECIRWGNESAT